MMVAWVPRLLLLARSAFGALHGGQVRSARCEDFDNCGRAVTGTSAYSLATDLRLSDCSSFMADTVTIGVTTTTSTLTTTITSAPNASIALHRREIEPSGKSVPWYAWPCDVERYAEVCSCAGFPPATISEKARITTKTVTKTKLVASSALPRRGNSSTSRTLPTGIILSSSVGLNSSPTAASSWNKTSASTNTAGKVPSSMHGTGAFNTSRFSPTSSSNSTFLTLSWGDLKSSTSSQGSLVPTVTSTLNATTTTASVTCTAVDGRTICPTPTPVRQNCAPPTPDLCSGAGGACVDVQTDAKNCGKCGNRCSSGICQNGVCSTAICMGSSCGQFSSCNGDSTCICGSAVDGAGFCLDGNITCGGLRGCESNADCGSGEICAVDTCCDRNVCIKSDTCDNSRGFSGTILMSSLTGKEATVGGNFMDYL